MEILPGEGLSVARLGWTSAQIQSLVGPPTRTAPGQACWREHSPPFTVYFDDQGLTQLVEVYAGNNGHDHATLRGVQLTHRLMDDVVADLARAGVQGDRTDLVAEFGSGFMLWSLLSVGPEEVGAGSGTDDCDRDVVVEGIAVAPAEYWAAT